MRHGGNQRNELLLSIIEWSGRTARIISNQSLTDFLSDETLQLAAQKCIEAIGEGAGRILKSDPDFAEKHPELELAEVYRIRNRLSHGYDSVDLMTVWNAASLDIPKLKTAVEAALHETYDTKSP
jgi:uncharacterized protein with HEPN domain